MRFGDDILGYNLGPPRFRTVGFGLIPSVQGLQGLGVSGRPALGRPGSGHFKPAPQKLEKPWPPTTFQKSSEVRCFADPFPTALRTQILRILGPKARIM